MTTVTKNQVSDRVLNMAESATLKMTRIARELRAEGHDVISLSVGEPDFDTPQHIKDAAIQALNEGFTKYTPVPGIPELREAICAKFKRDNNIDLNANQIVVSNGAKQSIANLALALLNKGDEAVILAPYWVSYYEIIKLGEGKPVPVCADISQDFKVTPAQLEAVITEKTKMVLFSSPCNPTGSVYTKEELEGLAAVIERYENITVVADEIYEYINFGDRHVSIGSLPNMKDRTVTVNGFSKGFAMTGWRLGYIGAPAWIAAACTKIQGQFTSGASSFGQKAATIALNSGTESCIKMGEKFLERRNMVIDLLNQIDGFKVNQPQGAFYVFPDISAYFGKSNGTTTINNSEDFCEYILHSAHVAVVAGSAFGIEGCFRLSYAAADDQLKEAVKRISAAVSQLK